MQKTRSVPIARLALGWLLVFAVLGMTQPGRGESPGEAVAYRMIGWSDYFGVGDDIIYLDSDVSPTIGGNSLITLIGQDRIRVTDAFGGLARDYVSDGQDYDSFLAGLTLLAEPETPFGSVPDWLMLPRAELRPFVSDQRAQGRGLRVLLLTADRAVFLANLFNAAQQGYGSTTILVRIGSDTMDADFTGERLAD